MADVCLVEDAVDDLPLESRPLLLAVTAVRSV
jgi:hypothetical protein